MSDVYICVTLLQGRATIYEAMKLLARHAVAPDSQHECLLREIILIANYLPPLQIDAFLRVVNIVTTAR